MHSNQCRCFMCAVDSLSAKNQRVFWACWSVAIVGIAVLIKATI